MNDYLIDTSIWIDFFRGKSEPIKSRIFNLLEENRIHYNGIVLGELLIGAVGKKEFDFINENFLGLNYLEMGRSFFIQVSKIGRQLKRSGISLPLSDTIIACHAKINKLILFTKDKHFETIGKTVGFQYDIIEKF